MKKILGVRPKIHVVLISGGRTSVFLAKYYKEKHNLVPVAIYHSKGKPTYWEYRNDNGMRAVFLFMNTGKERKETLMFMNDVEKNFGIKAVWLEALVNNKKGLPTSFKIVNFNTASRNGKPFEDMLMKYPMPHNRGVSNCTRELKQRPKEQFLKKYFNNHERTEVIGIRFDEAHRKSIHAEKEGIIYPLCDEFKVNSEFIRSWWSRQDFDLKLKDYEGNCDLCFKKSLKKRLTIIKENPLVADWWAKMEDKHSDTYTDENQKEQSRFFDLRSGLSIHDLVNMAKKPFETAKDLHELSQQQIDLFEIETDCFCKTT